MKPDTLLRSVFGRCLAVPATAAVLLAATPCSGVAQNEQNVQDAAASPQLAALVNELALQIREIEKNQAEIDQRLAKIEESVRQARIFAARSGRKGGGN